MLPQEIFISVGAGLCTFILLIAYKKSKNENVVRSEVLKMSMFVSAIIYGILMLYNKPTEPVLSEPFLDQGISVE